MSYTELSAWVATDSRRSNYNFTMLIFSLFLLLAIVFAPQLWVKHTLSKYHQPPDRYRGSGAELARMLLDQENLAHVTVEKTDRGDHYDPIEKAVRLSPECFDARSLTAITVAAHEVGHALQDRDADVQDRCECRPNTRANASLR